MAVVTLVHGTFQEVWCRYGEGFRWQNNCESVLACRFKCKATSKPVLIYCSLIVLILS